MKSNNFQILSGSDNQSITGSAIDGSQLISLSAQASFGDAQAAGTFKLQASNDILRQGYNPSNFTPTNWVDIPNQSANITSGTSSLLTVSQMAYRWVRAVWTMTGTGVQTIVPLSAGAFETITVAIPATAAATQGDYFVLYNEAGQGLAFWFSIDGDTTAPTGATYLSAVTKVMVSISTGDSAIVNAAAIITGGANANGYNAVDNLDGTITWTNTSLGVCSAPISKLADGTGTGSATPTVDLAGAPNAIVDGSYFYLNSANGGTGYYVWMDLDGGGNDPAIVGRTGVPIAVSSGDSAGTIGAAIAAAINALAEFAASGTTTVTVTNSASGPFTPITDAGATGFTFAVTGGGSSTISVNANVISI